MNQSRYSHVFGVALAMAVFGSALLRAADDGTFTPVWIKGAPAHPTRLLAKVKPVAKASAQASVLSANNLRAVQTLGQTPGWIVLDTQPAIQAMAIADGANTKARTSDLPQQIAALNASGLFEHVEPDYLIQVSGTPTDARFMDGTLWGLRNTGQSNGTPGVDLDAVHAWDVTTGSTDVVVAVIDSGVRYTHDDLATQMWRNLGEIGGNGVDDDHNGYVDDKFGIDAVSNSGDPDDDAGHGTHVAGTIGAAANNGHPMVGVAWNVRLMACKFLTADARGLTSDAIECVNYAVTHGADFLNCSWGGPANSSALRDALAAAGAAGVLVVAASGNESSNNDSYPLYPASYDLGNIVTVAAIDRTGAWASFSNSGPTSVDLVAPGVEIYSTLNFTDSAYGLAEGTSMAAPHVTGVLALLRTQFPAASWIELRDRLLTTVTPLPGFSSLVGSGGLVDAYSALTAMPDGELEALVLPATGTKVFVGRTTPVVVRVTDVNGVTGATVTGFANENQPLTFRDDGVAPDAIAQDANYTATFIAPAIAAFYQVPLAVTANAPGKAGTTVEVRYDLFSPPENDNFAARIAVSGVQMSASGSNLGGTKESGERNHAGDAGGASLWWSWTAPGNTTVKVTTAGSDVDTLLAVYTGVELPALVLVAENDDKPSDERRPPSEVQFSAVAGTTYQIAVDGFNGGTGSIALSLTTTLAPPSDHFAQATIVTGASVSVSGNLFNATREAGEPDHGSLNPGGSAWWRWTAPSSGVATIATTSNLVAAYTGGAANALTPVLGRPGYNGSSFAAEAGTTYNIVVAASSADWLGSNPFTLTLTLAAAAANDRFADRAVLSGANVTLDIDNFSATKEPGEPSIGLGGTLWWTWTAPTSGTATFLLGKDTLDVALVVYTGSTLATLATVATNEGYWLKSQAIFTAVGGSTYQIQFDSKRTPVSGVQLIVQLGSAPPNDQFVDRLSLGGETSTSTVSSVGATVESGEPLFVAYRTGSSLWWSWVAPDDGTATITSTAPLGVFEGATLPELTPVNGLGFTPFVYSVTFHARKGVEYSIISDGIFGFIGNITVAATWKNGPLNDMFVDRTSLAGSQASSFATLTNGTVEGFEPRFAWSGPRNEGASVWWTWTAPAHGRAQITANGASASVIVLAGGALNALTRVRDVLNQEADSGTVVFDAIAGTTYQIAVGMAGTPTGSFELRLRQTPAPANDLFAHRTALVGGAVSTTGTNVGAYFESYESSFGPQAPGASVWWSWTAPKTGWVEIDTLGSDFDTTLGVFTGTDVTQLTQTALNGDAANGVTFSRVAFTATAGTTYQIAVFGNVNTTGSISLNLGQYDAPANDAFGGRIALTGDLVSVSAANHGATRESGEPAHGQSGTLGATVWWSWVAPGTGAAIVTLDSVNPELKVAVYRDASSTLVTLVPVMNSVVLSGDRRAIFHAQQGVTYAIAVGVRQGGPGPFELNVSLVAPPSNDFFADRTFLTGDSVTITGTCVGATREAGDPLHSMGAASVWWTWTAPRDGRACMRWIRDETVGMFLSVYTGAGLQALAHVASGGSVMPVNYLSWDAKAGVAYNILVADPFAQEGIFRFDLDLVDSPANDDFADRFKLTGAFPSTNATNLGATGEAEEPNPGNFPEKTSVWWTWTAPLATRMIFRTADSDFDTVPGIYTGPTLDELTSVGFNDDAAEGTTTSRVVLNVEAGTRYSILVAGKSGAMGAIVLKASPGEPPLANAVVQNVQNPGAGSSLILFANATGNGPFSYRWLCDGEILQGQSGATLILPSVQLFDSGSYSVRIRNEFGESESPIANLNVIEPLPSNARLTNLSTRALARTGDNVLIPGFVIAGPGNKQLLIRAVGPTLGTLGVAGTLPNPRLTLKRWNGVSYDDVATNDNWGTNANAAEIAAKSDELFAFALNAGSADAALLVDLAPGQYSAIAGDAGTGTGIAIVELYDADLAGGPSTGSGQAPSSQLINISNRGYVGTGDSIMIPGYVVSSEGPKTLLIRAVGPALAEFGVTGVLLDPTLTIFRRINNTEEEILANNDWSAGPGAQRTRDVATQVQAFALTEGSKDAAFVVTLNPGVYTVHARGANNTTGVALVEVYAVP